MTTIAYRDGVMAADSGVWLGEACNTWVTKVAKGSDGALYGVAGNMAQCQGFLKAVIDGEFFANMFPVCGAYISPDSRLPTPTGDDASSFLVLVAPPSGPLKVLAGRGVESYDAPYLAIGGGSATAMGALYAGGSAEVAIAATIEHGSSAIGKVHSVRRDV